MLGTHEKDLLTGLKISPHSILLSGTCTNGKCLISFKPGEWDFIFWKVCFFLIHFFHCAPDCWYGLDSNGCVGVRARV